MNDRIAFLGLSHLGIVSSAAWASRGAAAVGVDPDAALVAALERRELPIHEAGLPELIAACGTGLRYSARVSDLADRGMVVISRDVPTDAHGRSDAGAVTELLDVAIPHLAQDVVLVLMSQVSPGFTRAAGERIRRQRPGLRFKLLYLVETLIFGDAVRRAISPERFIVGAADPSAPLPDSFRRVLEGFGCPILTMSYESAEFAKTAINLYLIGSVTYANTMADLCEAIGADWSQVVPALRLDARIGPAAYLRPGLGIAGGNLERDLQTQRALGLTHDVDTTLLDAFAAHNERRFEWALRRAARIVETTAGTPTIGLFGLSYKKGTRSLKNAPSLRLIEALRGRARLRAWDPVVSAADLDHALGTGHGALVVGSPNDAASGADAAFVLTGADELQVLDYPALRGVMRHPVLVDCVGVLDRDRALAAGIEIQQMGREGGRDGHYYESPRKKEPS